MIATIKQRMTDYIAAIVPALANLTISEVNEYLATISTVAGLAFLAWRWWKAYQRDKLTGTADTTPPIPPK